MLKKLLLICLLSILIITNAYAKVTVIPEIVVEGEAIKEKKRRYFNKIRVSPCFSIYNNEG